MGTTIRADHYAMPERLALDLALDTDISVPPTRDCIPPAFFSGNIEEMDRKYIQLMAAEIVKRWNAHNALVKALRLSGRNVRAIINSLPAGADVIDGQNLDTWNKEIIEALGRNI